MTAQPPRSMGGDQRPVESYAQMTVGNSESRDHTPMIGALDSPLASGAKAGGNCGNPDCTEHNHNGWSVIGPGGESTGPAYPLGDPLPGTGTTDEKKAAQYNTQADRRLRAMWLEREYFGAKPGEQVGAILVDDGRDIRKPLASAPCPGGNGGPHKFGSGGQEKPPNGWSVGGNGLWTGPAVRPDGPRFLPAGPWPLQPNDWAMTQDGRSVWCGEGDPPTDGHTQDSGTTEEAENAWDKVKGFVEGLGRRGQEVIDNVVDTAKTLVNKVSKTVTDAVDSVRQYADTVIAGGQALVEDVKNYVKGVGKSLQDIIDVYGESLLGVDTWTNIRSVLTFSNPWTAAITEFAVSMLEPGPSGEAIMVTKYGGVALGWIIKLKGQWKSLRFLDDGKRVRYYQELTPPKTDGPMKGRRFVKEVDPVTGKERYWHETVDKNDKVRRVRPDNPVTDPRYHEFDAD